MKGPARFDNLRRLRFSLQELSGGLGDLGTFVPLALAMIQRRTLRAGPVLLFSGLANIGTGLVFGQPLPVQPMKAIATVGITEGLSAEEVAAAGICIGIVLLVLGTSGLANDIMRWVPAPIVRGIQLGIGVKIAIRAAFMISALDWWGAIDSRAAALATVLLVGVTWRMERFPAALVLLTLGLIAQLPAATTPQWSTETWLSLSLGINLPTLANWGNGLWRAASAQLPLTLLNSVLAVATLSEDLFPGRGVSPTAMATSVGIMNIAPCLFGALPMCHGSGGLAAQYRFGGRTGGSVIMLGGLKVGVAMIFGAAADTILVAFPHAILAPMLLVSGVSLALPARNCRGRDAFTIAVMTAIGVVGLNTWVGFMLGCFTAACLNWIPSK